MSAHKKVSAFFDSLLEDNSGGYSTVRVLLVMTTLIVLFVFVRASFQSAPGTIPDIPGNVYALLGTMWAAKAVQRFGEQPPQVIPPSNNSTQ
jgi:hypothetical protein